MPLTPTDGSGTYWADGLPILIVRRATDSSKLVGIWLDGLPFLVNDESSGSTGTITFDAPVIGAAGAVAIADITAIGAVEILGPDIIATSSTSIIGGSSNEIPALVVSATGAAWNALGTAAILIPKFASSGLGSTLPASSVQITKPAVSAAGVVGAPANVTFGVPLIEGSLGVIGPSTVEIEIALIEAVGEIFDPPAIAFDAPLIEAVGEVDASRGELFSTSEFNAVGQEGHWPESATLRAIVEDDAWGGTLTYEWSQVSGPVTATIVSPTSPKTEVFFEEIAGVYIFQLQVSREDGLVGSALMRVRIYTNAVPESAILTEDPGIVTLEVNTVLRAAQIGSTRISDGIDQVSRCMFTLYDGATPDVALMNIGDDMVLSRYGERLFGGVCLSYSVTDKEGYPFYNVSVIGYAWHFLRTIITKTYTNWPLMSIVADLLSQSVGGITIADNTSLSTPDAPTPPATPQKTFAEVLADLQAAHVSNAVVALYGARIGHNDAVALQAMTSVPETQETLGNVIGHGDLRALIGIPVIGGPVAVTGISIEFIDKNIAECLTELTKYARGLHWKVDAYKKLHFTSLEIDLDPAPITVTHPTVKDLSVTHTMGQSANRMKIYYTEPSPTEANGDKVEQGSVIGPIAKGATKIQVSSLAGFSPTGGMTTINGQKVSWSGTAVVRAASVYDRVTFLLTLTHAVEGGELGQALAERPSSDGGRGVTPPDDEHPTTHGPGGPYNPRGYWLSLNTPDGETPLMQYFDNGAYMREGNLYPVSTTHGMEYWSIHERSIEVTVLGVKYQDVVPDDLEAPAPRTDRCTPTAESTPEDRQAAAWSRVTSINVYRDGRPVLIPEMAMNPAGAWFPTGATVLAESEKSKPGDEDKTIYLVGSLPARGGKFVDSQPKWDLGPVAEPPYLYKEPRKCPDGSNPWDPPNTFFLTGVKTHLPKGTRVPTGLVVSSGTMVDGIVTSEEAIVIGLAVAVTTVSPDVSKTFVIVNDLAAQHALALRLSTSGGATDAGVIEAAFDAGTKSRDDATAIGEEFLRNARVIDTTLTCTIQDARAQPGQILDMDMPVPYGKVSLKIQQMDISGFELGVRHDHNITAATELVRMEDLLKGR